MMDKTISLSLLTLLLYILEYCMKFKEDSKESRWQHSLTNFSFIIISSVLLRALFYVLIYFNIDFFSLSLFKLPSELNFLYFVILDFLIYIQHILSHKLDWFWALHKVHHADHFLDTSSGLRFHPLEICVSYLYKMAIVILIGVPKDIFVLYEIILSAMALFNHSNIKIPHFIDRYLRLIIVTPSFHYVHHSTNNEEMNAHFGNALSVWDRLFKTYKQDSLDRGDLVVGLSNVSKKRANSIKEMLLFPLRRD